MTFCGKVPIPDPPPPPSERCPIRRTCGNCGLSADAAGDAVTCHRDGRGFDNHPVPNQVYPASRGGCLHHQFRARVITL